MTPAYVLIGADKKELTKVSQDLFEETQIAVFPQIATEGSAQLFLIPADSRPQLETLPDQLEQLGCELYRIIAVVNAHAYESQPQAKAYWEMLAHFADIMIVQQTHSILPFQKHWRDRPMSIYQWPRDIHLSPEICTCEARRLSQYFDIDSDAEEIEIEEEDDTMPTEPVPVDEPYFARDATSQWKVKLTLPATN